MKDLFYSFVIFVVGVLNVLIDNWLIILLIVLVSVALYFIWKVTSHAAMKGGS